MTYAERRAYQRSYSRLRNVEVYREAGRLGGRRSQETHVLMQQRARSNRKEP